MQFYKAFLLSLFFLLTACSSATRVDPIGSGSGFLDNYEQLAESKNGSYEYVRKDVNFSKYNKIIIQPIQIYTADGEHGSSQVALQDVADELRTILQKTLADSSYEVTESAGLDTARLQLALVAVATDKDDKWVYKDEKLATLFRGNSVKAEMDDQPIRVVVQIKLTDTATHNELAVAAQILRENQSENGQAELQNWAQQIKQRLDAIKEESAG